MTEASSGTLPPAVLPAGSSGVSPAEVARFNALASGWWDPKGPMRPLHAMNPARIGWIVSRAARRFPSPDGIRLLDVGCGAGLAAEALARRGFDVLGIDAAADLIDVARDHAGGLPPGHRVPAYRVPAYRVAVAEDLLAEGVSFPVITALEVVEHVPDPAAFVRVLVRLLEPGGLLFLSTLNRTRRSFLVAKLGAEYVLRILPVGTHDWRRFIAPAELAASVRSAGARVTETAGLSPGLNGWRVTRDLGVNYLLAAEK
ncbi:MAG: bifunctional 2-polyprenyl-6-hydroxyphenol methylase/3-demethylubiquinol 3-O-methyltransferase UbiG [Acetobacteraceae bacterium]|jgi:2-polyprenyl-6-hydroxyphenyl methylase/3-demethylubiquinone-9 3-methyltransferase